MTNSFMVHTANALRALKIAQTRHARLRSRADNRLKAAQSRHTLDVDAAANVEAAAWRALLAVPGMTVTTAAALCETSEATVHRWVSRSRTTAQPAR
ncbi:MAG: hypothetical protein PSX37_01935 [bacterium]|nr:hypothetical protein [bacterium]